MKKYLLPLIASSAFALCFLIASNAHAALSVVQVKSIQSSTTSTLVSITTTAGNLIVVFEANNQTSFNNNTSTDSAGQSYSLAISSATSSIEGSFYYVASSSALTSVRCNYAGTTSNSPCIVYEISGAASTAPFDVAVGAGQNATNLGAATSGIMTTTNTDDILIFATRAGNTEAWSSTSTPAGWTVPANGTTTRGGTSYFIASSTLTNVSTTLLFQLNNATNINALVAFKAAAAGSSTPAVALPDTMMFCSE